MNPDSGKKKKISTYQEFYDILRKYGYEVGLLDDERYQKLLEKEKLIDTLMSELKRIKIVPAENAFLTKIGTSEIKDGISLYNLLKRPEVDIMFLKDRLMNEYSNEVLEQANILIRYEGYIKKANEEASKMLELEGKIIPYDINYDDMHNLASEAKQKLKEVRPTSLGQALRISGVNPADISVLMIYLKRNYRHE